MFKKNNNISGLLNNLKAHYPTADCALNHKTPFQLLVATILSAQCTDERVNKVTKTLFKKHKTAKDFSALSQSQLEKEIRSTGFYRNKAKNIRGMSKMVQENFSNNVPQKMAELLALPGVARKTANVVLGVAFGKAEGIVVDTHVSRLSNRLGLSNETLPVKIEKDLMAAIPKNDWIWIAHALIRHGRQICTARNPQCDQCPVRKNCANPVR